MDKQKLKPVVCILNPDDIHWMQEKRTDPSNSSVNLLTPYQAKELEEKQHVVFPEIRENKVFMLDPLGENKYIFRTPETDAKIVAKRINAIMVIVALLGGKNFQAISLQNSTQNVESQVGVDVKLKVPKVGVNSNTNYNRKTSKQAEKKRHIIAEFNGKYSKSNYRLAVKVAEQYGLSDDPTISDLLITRRPNSENYTIRKEYEVNTCEDLKENLKIAGDLMVDIRNAVNVDVKVDVTTSQDGQYIDNFKFTAEFVPIKKRWIMWAIGGAIAVLAAALVIALL